MKRFLCLLTSKNVDHRIAAHRIATFFGPYCETKFKVLYEMMEAMKTKEISLDEIKLYNKLMYSLCTSSSEYANIMLEKIPYFLMDTEFHTSTVTMLIKTLALVDGVNTVSAYNLLLSFIELQRGEDGIYFSISLLTAGNLATRSKELTQHFVHSTSNII